MRLIFGLVICSLIFSGCSSLEQQTVTQKTLSASWLQHMQAVKFIEQWQANAKVAITVDNKTQKSKMTWRQQQQHYSIVFSLPFGQSGPTLVGNETSATLSIPKEEPITGHSAGQLLEQRLGWTLPVENAKFWILGIPSPNSESKVLLKNERLTKLRQDGWLINYDRYKRIDGLFMPSKITISRGNFSLLLIVYKWAHSQQVIAK